MPLFLIITKLLLLKILAPNTVVAYDYGFHPSAEEFDKFVRGSGRTWTRDLIANERRRAWYRPTSIRRSDTIQSDNTRIGEIFVPKFNNEQLRRPHESIVNSKFPEYIEKVVRKSQNTRDDRQSAQSSNVVHIIKPQNIGSSLDFHIFGDDESEANYEKPSEPVKENYISAISHDPQPSESVFNTININKNISTTSPLSSSQSNPIKTSQGSVIEIDNGFSNNDGGDSRWHSKYSVNNLYKNNSEANFPIFFTNPVTGIVYAITEIGRLDENRTQTHRLGSNNTIPIYITKEQYDRDMFLVKRQYEEQCRKSNQNVNFNNNKNPYKPNSPSTLSVPMTTTHKPQIIHLQNPTVVSKLPNVKLPVKLNSRPPITVKVQNSAANVHGHVTLPPPNRTKKSKSKKKKRKRRPGRKTPVVLIQKSAISEDLSQLSSANIGEPNTTPIPHTSSEMESAQLERPNDSTTTIFEAEPIAATSGYVIPPQSHHLSKRSVSNSIENSTITSTTQASIPPTTTEFRSTKSLTKQSSIHRMPKIKRKRHNILKNSTFLGFRHRNNTMLSAKKRNKTLVHRNSTTEVEINRQHKNSTKTKVKKRRKGTKRGQDDDGFDILDLLDDDDDDDEADEDEYYLYDETKKKLKKKIPKRNTEKIKDDDEEKGDTDDDDASEYSNESPDNQTDLKEQITHDNSSSAEEGVDFGALEEIDMPAEVQHEAPPEFELFSSETKNTNGKKRIRRRPSASSESYEDYNDKADDDDDDDDGGGVGGFFRMLFYPVQVVMGRIVDTVTGTNSDSSDEETNDKFLYPTYTQYSSATNTAAQNNEDDEEDQGVSISKWFSSLFDFNRRTKKMATTTTTPQSSTEAEKPGWFESWFGFGLKTSSAETSASSEDYDDYDKWFSSWFGSKTQAKRRTATTSTTTPAIPQVPILTIVDPLKNPQNWLGILAHHIINSTTTTHNPLMDVFTRATTQNPEIPRLISYDKYQIWRLKPQNEAHVKALEEYKRTEEGVKLQWLKGPSLRGLTDVLVSPKMFVDFQATLQFESIAHEILIFDVGKAIAYEQAKEQYYLTTPRPHKHQQKQKYASLINMSWNKYYNYDDIIKYLESVRMRHPQIVELFHIGRSYEGRPLVVAKLEMKSIGGLSNSGAMQSNHKKLRHKKKSGQANAVFIEAGTHGLEWIGPATATWMINELLRLMKSNKTTSETDFIRNTTWYIMPVLNPDGYVYSHEYDRFWKKSRSRHISRPGGLINSAMTWLQQKKISQKICYGVDLDRNWHYQWGKRGSSKTPCNEYYAGPTAFSEPETKALSDFLMDNRKQINLYISMQAYGQIISYPTKVNMTFDRERLDDFMDVAMAGVDGLRRKGNKSRYKIDSANDLIEHRAGCSDAFAAYEVGIPFSYTLYLADNGVHGYLLPSSSIEPTARDAFEIILSMFDYI